MAPSNRLQGSTQFTVDMLANKVCMMYACAIDFCVNIVSATKLLTHGIVYPTVLCLLVLLVYLRIDLISSGRAGVK